MKELNAIRSALYAVARVLGWVNALVRGTLMQRTVRVGFWRAFASFMGRIMK